MGVCLIFVLFQEHRAQVKLNIVGKDRYKGKRAVCLKSDCPRNIQFEWSLFLCLDVVFWLLVIEYLLFSYKSTR